VPLRQVPPRPNLPLRAGWLLVETWRPNVRKAPFFAFAPNERKFRLASLKRAKRLAPLAPSRGGPDQRGCSLMLVEVAGIEPASYRFSARLRSSTFVQVMAVSSYPLLSATGRRRPQFCVFACPARVLRVSCDEARGRSLREIDELARARDPVAFRSSSSCSLSRSWTPSNRWPYSRRVTLGSE
jgi:hypothetical protein